MSSRPPCETSTLDSRTVGRERKQTEAKSDNVPIRWDLNSGSWGPQNSCLTLLNMSGKEWSQRGWQKLNYNRTWSNLESNSLLGGRNEGWLAMARHITGPEVGRTVVPAGIWSLLPGWSRLTLTPAPTPQCNDPALQGTLKGTLNMRPGSSTVATVGLLDPGCLF